MKRIFLLKFVIILILTPYGYTDSFTDLQIGARPQGMGGAFVAVANDANSLYWNPAGLIQNCFPEITTMHGVPFGIKDIISDYLAYCQPLGLRYGFGVSFLRNSATLEQGIERERTKMTEDIYALSFGLAVNTKMSIGLNIKRLVIDTKIESGAGFGFDLGLFYKFTDYISFGAILRNLASDIKDEKIPPTYRVGMAIRFRKGLLWAFDVNTKRGINNKEGVSYLLNTGLEKSFGNWLTLRVGLNQNYKPSFGIGIFYHTLNIDYAYFKYNEDLDYSHRISFSLHYAGE